MPTADSEKSRYRFAPMFLIGLALLLFVIQAVDYINFTVDDVFISLRIAVNAAAGHGFVYNPGEMVEGHSDPLWVAMIALIIKSGVVSLSSPWTLVWVARALSILFGSASVAAVYVLARKIFKNFSDNRFYSALAALGLVVCSPFILWSVGVLEMTLTAFCYTLAAVFLYDLFDEFRNRQQLSLILVGVTFAIASLTRPEPVLVAGAVFVYLFLSQPKKIQTIICCILPYTIIMGLFELWRWKTYADLLPNTFYAKTGGGLSMIGMGVKYTLESFGGIGGVLLVFIPFAFGRNERLKQFRVSLLVMIIATSFFSIYSSGDWMPGFRFFIPIAPIAVILGIIGIRNVLARIISEEHLNIGSPSMLFGMTGVAIASMLSMRILLHGQLLSSAGNVVSGFKSISGYSLAEHKLEADWLASHTKGGDLFATGEAGLTGYLNPSVELLDLQGLLDKKIARDRKAMRPFDCEYILARAPKYIIINRGADVIGTNSFYTVLYNDPHFQQQYVFVDRISFDEIFARRDSVK